MSLRYADARLALVHSSAAGDPVCSALVWPQQNALMLASDGVLVSLCFETVVDAARTKSLPPTPIFPLLQRVRKSMYSAMRTADHELLARETLGKVTTRTSDKRLDNGLYQKMTWYEVDEGLWFKSQNGGPRGPHEYRVSVSINHHLAYLALARALSWLQRDGITIKDADDARYETTYHVRLDTSSSSASSTPAQLTGETFRAFAVGRLEQHHVFEPHVKDPTGASSVSPHRWTVAVSPNEDVIERCPPVLLPPGTHVFSKYDGRFVAYFAVTPTMLLPTLAVPTVDGLEVMMEDGTLVPAALVAAYQERQAQLKREAYAKTREEERVVTTDLSTQTLMTDMPPPPPRVVRQPVKGPLDALITAAQSKPRPDIRVPPAKKARTDKGTLHAFVARKK